MPHPYFADAAHPRVLAHRGLVTRELEGQGVAENTLSAIQAAHDAGALYIECDCHVTLDGEVVLFHDADLRRVAGDPRRIASVTSQELTRIMESRGGMATLQQALHLFPDTRFNVDVKAAAAAEPAGRIIAPHAARVLVTSFSDQHRTRALTAAAQRNRTLRPATSPGRSSVIRVLAALATRSRQLIDRAFEGLDALQIPERQGPIRVLTPQLVDAAHRAHVEIHIWTVNDEESMKHLVDIGVDGIVTDRADVALRLLG